MYSCSPQGNSQRQPQLLLLIEYIWSLAPTQVLQVSTAYDSYVLNDEVASLPKWYH